MRVIIQESPQISLLFDDVHDDDDSNHGEFDKCQIRKIFYSFDNDANRKLAKDFSNFNVYHKKLG